MFDIGWSELLVIGVVALIAIGPKELPGVLRSVGFWMGKVRRMAAEFQGQFQEAMREAEMADLKKHADDLNDTAKQLTSSFENFDPLKDAGTAKRAESSSSAATETSEPEVQGVAVQGEAAVPGSAEVVALPGTQTDVPAETPPETATPETSEPTPPVRREA